SCEGEHSQYEKRELETEFASGRSAAHGELLVERMSLLGDRAETKTIRFVSGHGFSRAATSEFPIRPARRHSPVPHPTWPLALLASSELPASIQRPKAEVNTRLRTTEGVP